MALKASRKAAEEPSWGQLQPGCTPSPGEHVVEHLLGESTGERVLLTDVITPEDGHAVVESDLPTMPEHRASGRHGYLDRPQR